jgi:hypothetical protein
MGDSTCSETLELQSRQMEEDAGDREILDGMFHCGKLCLNEDSIPWILKNIDYFVSQTRGNETVGEVVLGIVDPAYFGDEDHVSAWRAQESRSFARAIHGHPTITRFEGGEGIPYEASDALYSALATLPALESIQLSNHGLRTREDESALANPESLTELLRVPSLRSVCFEHFYFTRALCQATANALMEGTVITKLEFLDCSFSAEESAAIMANGLTRNTSVVSISVKWPLDEAVIGAVAAALPSNSTLRELSLMRCYNNGVRWSPVFLALGNNTGIKTLNVDGFGLTDESLCAAMQNGLGMNVALESLKLKYVPLRDDNIDLWCGAFSFLRTNKALNSLAVDVNFNATKSCLSAFSVGITTMLQDNTSLESLSITGGYTRTLEEYVTIVTALQHNTTLKCIKLIHYRGIRLTNDEDKQMAVLLKKNYALEMLPDIHMENEEGDLGAILRLNGAGRRYLVQDGSSISKGVEVLSRVNNNINCVFLHLLENPRLCDRRAVEMVSSGESNSSRSTNPTAGSGGGNGSNPLYPKARSPAGDSRRIG